MVETVTIAPPTDADPDIWRVRLDGRMVARMRMVGEQLKIQRVGEAEQDKLFDTPRDAVEAIGYRMPGTAEEEHAWQVNTAAVFHPVSGIGQLPMVAVAGALVTVYVDEITGVLRVSVDTSTSEVPTDDDGVPLAVIEVNDGPVWVNSPDYCTECGRRIGSGGLRYDCH